MERLRQKTAGNYALSVVATNEDGVLVTPAAPVTLAITDGAGTAVGTGPYTGTAACGSITAAVPVADLAELDLYTCVWTDDDGAEWTSYVELCGGYLVELADVRDLDALYQNESKFPASRLRAARTAAEVRFEAAAGVAMVPRCNRVRLIGDGGYRIVVPNMAVRSVRSITVDDGTGAVALTADELAALTVREWGAIDHTDGTVWEDADVIEVCYEHGLDYPPATVREAMLLLVPEYLTRKALASRATAEVTDVGTFRLSVAGARNPTGIPEVDRIAADVGRAPLMVS